MKSNLLIASLLLHLTLSAQQYPFVQYTPKDGLVNSRVRKVFQDSRGRIYFLTFGGLSMYDGARFTNYTIQNGLAIDMVNDIIELGDDSLLIATNTDQLNILVHGQMRKFGVPDKKETIINQFLKSSDGSIYATADQGLFELKGQQFAPFLQNDYFNPYLGTLVEWGDWLICGTNDLRDYTGLYIYNKKKRIITDAKVNLRISSLAKDRANHIWVSLSDGIHLLDSTSLLQGSIRFAPVAAPYEQLNHFGASSFSFAPHDTWLIKSGNEIVKAGDDGSMITIKFPDREGPAGRNSIYVDRENIAWICTEANGVIKLANTRLRTESVGSERNEPAVIKSACYVHDTTWYLLNDKLARKTKNDYHEFIGNIPAGFFCIGQYDGMLIGSDGKSIYSARIPAAGQSISFSHDLTLPDTSALESKSLVDPNGYIITYSRTHLYVVKQDMIIYQLPLRTDDFIEGIKTDAASRLWVLTRYSGIMIFTVHPESPEFYLQSSLAITNELKEISPRCMLLDKNNMLWIGTRYTGLVQYRFNGSGLQKLRQFQTTEGLTDNFVTSLAGDSLGNIIVGTQTGLDRLLVSTTGESRIENITRSSNIFGMMKTIWVNSQHETYALTNSGTLFQLLAPEKNNKNFQPQLFIQEIRNNNKTVPFTASLRLPYSRQNLVFNIAAPTFIDEKQVLYSYRLSGTSDDSWSEPSSNATINLLNLPAGNYSLQVRANFHSTAYTPEELSYSFTITPPWWQTWWARSFMWIGIASILILFVTLYYRRKLERQRVALEKQQAIEKERTRIASDMHDDLGAGLSTIKFLSEKLGQSTANETDRTDADRIANNSNELVQKMNEIIWAMNEKNDTLEDLLFYTRSYASEYCEENGLECETSLSANISKQFVSGEIRRNVFLTVKESLHNIVKHAEATQVKIDFETEQDLTVTISDNGKGMAVLNEEESGGNGLRNMQRRIESIKGSFRIVNANGITITVKVPLKG
ncbi:MAG: ATP-binding protein [Chitinophagaceae bacterium]